MRTIKEEVGAVVLGLINPNMLISKVLTVISAYALTNALLTLSV